MPSSSDASWFISWFEFIFFVFSRLVISLKWSISRLNWSLASCRFFSSALILSSRSLAFNKVCLPRRSLSKAFSSSFFLSYVALTLSTYFYIFSLISVVFSLTSTAAFLSFISSTLYNFAIYLSCWSLIVAIFSSWRFLRSAAIIIRACFFTYASAP